MEHRLFLILLALTALMIVGCDEKNDDASIVLDRYYRERSINNPYLETIDSCEYIIWHNNKMTHKGNCRFCKERRQKELKELVEQLKKK